MSWNPVPSAWRISLLNKGVVGCGYFGYFDNFTFEQKGCERVLIISLLNKRVVKGFWKIHFWTKGLWNGFENFNFEQRVAKQFWKFRFLTKGLWKGFENIIFEQKVLKWLWVFRKSTGTLLFGYAKRVPEHP